MPRMKLRTCITSLSVLLLPLTMAATGCGGTGTGSGDMRSAGDMPASGRALKNLPTGCPTSETAADLYSTLVQSTCAVTGCHGMTQVIFQITSAADLHAKWVGKISMEGANSLPYITANNLDKSFLMYKIMGQQSGAEGQRMPNTGINLTNAQICKFIAWIESGAN